jgi:tetratricopeptide (TPR) repeat protein
MKNCFQKILFALCFLLLASQIGWAAEQGRQAQFQDASSSYSRGEYARAIQGFEALTHEGMPASLFYNLANSYAQAGQSGRAILNYERALRLAPGDSDIRGNLELVRKDKGLFQEEQTFGQRFVAFLGLNQWVVLAAAAFVLFAVLLLLPASVTLKRSSRYAFAAACLLISITASTGAAVLYQHWHDGVVVVADARLRVSPFESAASVGVIQEGRLVSPGKLHNNYILITDETGRSGWLSSDAFELIGVLNNL